jgi:hypothetical protein
MKWKISAAKLLVLSTPLETIPTRRIVAATQAGNPKPMPKTDLRQTARERTERVFGKDRSP